MRYSVGGGNMRREGCGPAPHPHPTPPPPAVGAISAIRIRKIAEDGVEWSDDVINGCGITIINKVEHYEAEEGE